MTDAIIDSHLQVVLIAGISGSTRLHEKLGSDEAARAVDRCIKRIERAIEAGKGRVVQLEGNEVVAAFDSGDAAVHAAIEMQQRIADIPPVSGVKIAIRVGITAGTCTGEESTESAELAREAALLAGLAKPTQTLASEKLRQFVTAALSAHLIDLGSPLTDAANSDSILEIVASLSPEDNSTEQIKTESRTLASVIPPTTSCLTLRYRNDTILLNENKPVVTIGRDVRCDIVLLDRRASRHHATIESRGNGFVLIDQSTNGSFVSENNGPEAFVRRSKFVLQGQGRIAFASSLSSPEADIVEFVPA